jgi:hypothetical protein
MRLNTYTMTSIHYLNATSRRMNEDRILQRKYKEDSWTKAIQFILEI